MIPIATDRTAKKRVLIVDDDVSITRILKVALERTGDYEVREEHQGLRALEAAEQFQPDVIVLDVCMPDRDGGDVAFQFRAHRQFKRLPIVFLTSLVSEQDAADGALRACGGFRFLPKTVSLEDLQDCLQEVMGV